MILRPVILVQALRILFNINLNQGKNLLSDK